MGKVWVSSHVPLGSRKRERKQKRSLVVLASETLFSARCVFFCFLGVMEYTETVCREYVSSNWNGSVEGESSKREREKVRLFFFEEPKKKKPMTKNKRQFSGSEHVRRDHTKLVNTSISDKNQKNKSVREKKRSKQRKRPCLVCHDLVGTPKVFQKRRRHNHHYQQLREILGQQQLQEKKKAKLWCSVSLHVPRVLKYTSTPSPLRQRKDLNNESNKRRKKKLWPCIWRSPVYPVSTQVQLGTTTINSRK